ncbi:MAG: hypothetical protein HUK08_09285, partial [Bacteroidaceae bacterium]|nr:hypothetical protein [Bacteroidaceae bacterium]
MADFNEQTLRFGDDNFESENKNMMSSNGNIRFGGFDDDDQSQSRGVNDAPAAKTVQSDASATPNMQQNQQPAKPKPQGVKKPAAAQPSAPVQPTVSTTPPGFGKKNLQIKLIVINNSGVVLNRYTVNQKEVTNDQTLTFQEERSSYDLIIGAEGYKDRRIQVTQTDLVRGEKRVTLATQLQRLTVSFDTPEGLKRGEIEIDMTNPVYKYIKDADHTDTPLNMLQIDGVGGKVLPKGGRLS